MKEITVGTRIGELAREANVPAGVLAEKAGIPAGAMEDILKGRKRSLGQVELLKITDRLPVSAQEFIYLQKLNQSPRKFQAYCVGIPKTGTTSLGAMLGKFRSGHEHMFKDVALKLIDLEARKLSRAEFEKFLRERDNRALLEMDSASFNYFYLDFLKRTFPAARYIFTIRDCYSWADSILNMYLGGQSGGADWMKEYTKFFLGIEFSVITSEEKVLKDPGSVLDRLLSYWSGSNRGILEKLPEGSLILRTHEISERTDDIARFLGVRGEDVSKRVSHLFKSRKKFDILEKVDRGLLDEKFDRYCRPLMQEFFPGFSLEEFLDPVRKSTRRLHSKNKEILYLIDEHLELAKGFAEIDNAQVLDKIKRTAEGLSIPVAEVEAIFKRILALRN